MIKKLTYLILFIIVSICSYSNASSTVSLQQKSISQIKDLDFMVDESLLINKDMRNTKYNIKFQIPDKVRKEVTFPEMNKGELYVYNKNKKLTYLPMFDQKTIDDITGNENKIIEVMNYIFQMEKTDPNFKKEYYEKKVKGIRLGKTTIIHFENYKDFNGYLFPIDFLITEQDNKGQENKVGELHTSDVKIDPAFSDKEFIIE